MITLQLNNIGHIVYFFHKTIFFAQRYTNVEDLKILLYVGVHIKTTP